MTVRLDGGSTHFSLLGRREDLKCAVQSHEEALMIRRTDPDAGASLAFQLEELAKELANDLVKEFEEYENLVDLRVSSLQSTTFVKLSNFNHLGIPFVISHSLVYVEP